MTDSSRIASAATPTTDPDGTGRRPRTLRVVLWAALVVGVAGTVLASVVPVPLASHVGLDLAFSALTLLSVIALVILRVRER